MKNILSVLAFMSCFAASAQDIRLTPLMNEDHGLDKSCNNCKSNVIIPVNIPPNTVFIYLAISTNKNGHFNNVNLFSQVKQLTDSHPVKILGDLRPLINLITGCEKGGKINFHVETDGHEKGRNLFNKGAGYVCDYSKCKIDFPGGPAGFQVIQNKEADVYYFGVENPSEKEGIYFHIEAVTVQRDY